MTEAHPEARRGRGQFLLRWQQSVGRLSIWAERAQHARRVKKRIRRRARAGEPVRVGFFVLYDSAFPGLNVARQLAAHDRFEPIIVLIPDTLRGDANMKAQLEKSAESMKDLGIRVVRGYDAESDTFVDVARDLDVIAMSNPYDELTHEYFTAAYLATQEVILFFVSYGFGISAMHQKIVEREIFRHFWRVFVPTRSTRRDYRDHANTLPGAIEVTGYPKMDNLIVEGDGDSERPMVIIAPHHTVRAWPGGLELSTFLLHAETFLELPNRYPGVDFVFRPHPLLFVHLAEDDLWGKVRSAQYLADMAAIPNVTVDLENTYMQTFARSSALIHDSGSFSAEYLYTGNPALFLSAAGKDPAAQFSSLGQQCLSHHYHATTADEIMTFLDDVVLAGNDPMKRARVDFASSTLTTHHPRASERIVARLSTLLPFETRS